MIKKNIEEIHQMIGGVLYINQQALDMVVEGVCIDSRIIQKGNIYFAIEGAKVNGHEFIQDAYREGSKLAIISDSSYISKDIACILVENVIVALQQLARMYRESLDVEVIGITGSNGKTSCKDMLSSILKNVAPTTKTLGNRNNEIGVPLTLLDMSEDTKYAVIEMGMENLDDIHFLNDIVKQDYGIVTNVGIAHLENLKTLENIGRAKLELMDGLDVGHTFIYNGDDKILKKIIKEKDVSKFQIETFGEKEENDIFLQFYEQRDNSILIRTNLYRENFTIPTIGKHQAINALAIILCAHKIGCTAENIQSGFDHYVATSMRNEVHTIGSCTILNDSYKSNPQSALAAIDTFEQIPKDYKIMVLGDMLDLGPKEKDYHLDLGREVCEYTFDELICFGDLSLYTLFGAYEKLPDKIYKHFDTHKKISDYLKQYKDQNCGILFKGSRGMMLNIVVDALIGDIDEKN